MGTGVRELLEPWVPGNLARAAEVLRAMSPAAAEEELAALARADNPSLRADAVLLAGEVAPDLGDELALCLLADPVGFVRWHACERLLFHGCYWAAGPLARLLVREPDAPVRSVAACALGHLGDRTHLPALAAGL